MFRNPADGLCADRAPGTVGAARRRRDRRLRAFLKHERMTVAMNLATIQHHSYMKSAVVDVGVQVGSPLAPVTEYVAPAPAVTFVVPSQQLPPVYSTTAVTTGDSSDMFRLVYPHFSSTAVEPFAPVVVGSLPPAEGFTEPVYNHALHERFAAGETTENIAEFPVVQEQVLVQAVPVVVDSLPPVEEFTGPVYNHVHHERFAAGETTENIAEFPVVQEHVLVQAVPEVVNSLPPVEEFTGPGYNLIYQEQFSSGEMPTNLVEFPVVHEQAIVQAVPVVVDSLPPVEEFSGPGFNQVHHEQIAAVPVVTEYFPMTDDEGSELSAGVRPAPLEEGRPQGKLQRHAGIGYELVLALDAPVLQMVEQLPDVHHLFATCLPVVAEQDIDVPKIILETIPSRRLCRDTQLAEQLVEVPTIVSYSSLQRNMEHNVDIPVPGGGGRRGRKRRIRLWPKLVRRPGQGSTAFHGAEHQELLGLQGLPPGPSSTTPFCGA